VRGEKDREYAPVPHEIFATTRDQSMTRARWSRRRRSGSRRSAAATDSRIGASSQAEGISPHRVAGVAEQALTSAPSGEISSAKLNNEDVTMTEEQEKKAPKSPEEIKAREQKKELREMREEVRAAREKFKAAATERAEVTARYAAMTEAMGLPPLKSKKKDDPISE
jgi:Fic family protein